MWEWLSRPPLPDPATSTMCLRLGAAALLGGVVALLHAVSSWLARRNADRPFMTTLVLLAVVIALVTIVIADNAARAFTLAGSLAIVRFRTVVEETRDTAFVIYAVVSGMAAGNDYFVAPLLCVPPVLLTLWWLGPPRAPAATPAEATLVLRLAAGRPPDPRIEDLLRRYAPGYRLAGVSTARGGAAFDLVYRLRLASPDRFFALLDELSRVEGVQSVELKD